MKLPFFLKSLLILTVFSLTTDAFTQCTQIRGGEWVSVNGGPCINTILTAVPFLRIAPDARSNGMGNAGIAASTGPNVMHFNSSLLVYADSATGIGLNYTPWFGSDNFRLNTNAFLAYISAYKKTSRSNVTGFSLRYFTLGTIDLKNSNGTIISSIRPRDIEVKFSYALRLFPKLAAALDFKYIYSNLATGHEIDGEMINSGTAFATDFSFTYKPEFSLIQLQDSKLTLSTIGLVISNMGSKISYTESNQEYLPTNLGLGLKLDYYIPNSFSITLGFDINKLLVPTPCLENCDNNNNNIPDYKEQSPLEAAIHSLNDAPNGLSEELNELSYSAGIEIKHRNYNMIALRGGYFTEHLTKGNRKFAFAGLGLNTSLIGFNGKFDFSYLFSISDEESPLANTFRLSMIFRI